MPHKFKHLSIVILLAVLLIVSITTYTAFQRNTAMLNVSSFALNLKQDSKAKAIGELRQLTKRSNDPILSARLTSLLTSTQNTEEAQQIKHSTLASLANNLDCGSYPLDFLLAISQPYLMYESATAKINLHSFESIGGAQGSFVTFTQNFDDCLVSITADFESSPNRYLTLSARMPKLTAGSYKLSASVKATGKIEAWFGLRKNWPGKSLSLSDDWRQTEIVLNVPSITNPDLLQILITGGHGTIYIRDVMLERLP